MVTPPSWRPDLTDPADLAEEVIRLEGYANIPLRMPRAAAGRGLTARQRSRRQVGRALADAGYVEVLSWPLGSAADSDALQLPPEDTRRLAVPIANPLSDDEPQLRTTLLPGLLRVLARNIGRGFADVALFETGTGVPPAARQHRVPRPSSRWTTRPRWRSSAGWTPSFPTSRCRWPPCWPATASCPAGGAGPDGSHPGRTRCRRPVRWARPAGSR